MTENEAIKVLEAPNKHINMIPVDGKDTLCYSAQLVGALEMAIKALEKQVPKKMDYMCSCGCVNLCFEYCPKCGQKLDWEGGE